MRVRAAALHPPPARLRLRCAARRSAMAPAAASSAYPTVEDTVGNTPLVRLQRLGTHFGRGNTILLKLEGNNPAGSVKDRPALSMIQAAEAEGRIKPGDTLIEATSGNTGIALAMAAAIKGYKMKLIMPANMSEERRLAMSAYGAELISVPPGQMEAARDLAKAMEARGEGVVLDQFSNPANPAAHFNGTGPEIWAQTGGRITHFVTSMGTTGTAMGTSRFLKSQNPDIQIVGLQPSEGASIAGIRRWPKEYLPSIFDDTRVDRTLDIGQAEAEETMRALARCEGVFAGVSSGGCVSGALRVAAEAENATIVCIICDRGDRYLSTGCFAPTPPAVADVADFPFAAARMLGMPAPHVLFTSGNDAATGEAWCPDCRRAVPAVVAAAAEAGVTLLVVDVGERPAWKDAAHPLRTMAGVELKCIPTLVAWDCAAGAPRQDVPRLDKALEAAADADAVAALARTLFAHK